MPIWRLAERLVPSFFSLDIGFAAASESPALEARWTHWAAQESLRAMILVAAFRDATRVAMLFRAGARSSRTLSSQTVARRQ